MVTDKDESYMNRRVEFKIANDTMENMEKPKRKIGNQY